MPKADWQDVPRGPNCRNEYDAHSVDRKTMNSYTDIYSLLESLRQGPRPPLLSSPCYYALLGHDMHSVGVPTDMDFLRGRICSYRLLISTPGHLDLHRGVCAYIHLHDSSLAKA